MDVVIPVTLGGYDVKYIGTKAFSNEENTNKLGSVDFSMATSLLAISLSAFENNNIETVDLSMLDKLSYVGSSAFKNNLITNVSFNNNLSYIYSTAFAYNNINTLTLPSNILSISAMAFYDNNLSGTLDLSSLTKLTQIGSFSSDPELYYVGAFQSNNLTAVILPNTLKLIGDGSFCENQISTVNIPSNVEKIGYYAFYYNDITSDLIFPNTLTDIRKSSFMYSIYGGTINFNSATSLKSIGESAFHGINLAAGNVIDFSGASNLEYIEKDAFIYAKIGTINFSGATKLKYIKSGAFYDCGITGTLDLSNSILLQYLGEDIASGTTIGSFETNSITEVILPNVAYQLHDSIFSNNEISSLTLGNKITKIGISAFARNSLTTVNIQLQLQLYMSMPFKIMF